MFCGPKIVDAHRHETSTVKGPQNMLFPGETVTKHFIICQESKKRQNKQYRKIHEIFYFLNQ